MLHTYRMKRGIALSVLLATLLVSSAHADILTPPYVPPTFYSEQRLRVELSLNGDALSPDTALQLAAGEPVALTFQINFGPNYFHSESPLTPEMRAEVFDENREHYQSYIELWRGEAFTETAERIESIALERVLTGEVSVTAPEPGRYFIVVYYADAVRDEAAFCAYYNIAAEMCASEGYFFYQTPDIVRQYFQSHYNVEFAPPSYGGYAFTVEEEVSGASNVLFLPGIKGSRLYEEADQLWPGNSNDVEKLFLDTEGKSIDPGISVDEGGVIKSVPLYEIYGSFMDSMDVLVEEGTVQDWRAIAYDWRLSLTDIVTQGQKIDSRIFYTSATSTPYIEQTLRELAATSNTGKVTIVAHSNGGLVAKALMQKLGDTETAALIDKVVFVGVPQSGAPQSIGALLYGFKEGLPSDWLPVLVSKGVSRAFALNAPMTYHLLPSEEYFDKAPAPLISFKASRSYAAEREAYGTTIDNWNELSSFLLAEEGGREKPPRDVTWEADVANPFLIEYAAAIHDSIDSWEPPEGVSVFQIAGWGIDTISGVEFYEQCIFSLCATKYRPTFVQTGDGVVPQESALRIPEASSVTNYWLDLDDYDDLLKARRDHGSILAIGELQQFLKEILVGMEAVPEFIRTAPPPSDQIGTRLRFFLHSPLSMDIVDADGDRLSANQIGGGVYGEFGEVKYASIPKGDYQLVLDGLAEGEFTLDIQEAENGTTRRLSTIASVPSSADTTVTMQIYEGQDTYLLELDSNSDGVVEETIPLVTNGASVYEPTSQDHSSRRHLTNTQTIAPTATSTLEVAHTRVQDAAHTPSDTAPTKLDEDGLFLGTPKVVVASVPVIASVPSEHLQIDQTASVVNALLNEPWYGTLYAILYSWAYNLWEFLIQLF